MLYLVLVFNNRMAADDYHVVDNIQKHGIWGSVKYEYESWSGRWSATLLSHAATAIVIQTPSTLPLMQLIIGILFSFSLFMFLKNSGLINFGSMSNMDKVFFTSTATAILFLATINKGDTWMWWCASFTYLLGMASIIAGVALILDKQSNRVKDICCVLTFIYAGGACEPAAATSLILMISYMMLNVVAKKTFLVIEHNKSRLILGTLALGISFAVCMLAPGNETRSSLFPNIGLMESFLLNFKMVALLFANKLILSASILLLLIPALLDMDKVKSETKATSIIFKLLSASLLMIFIYQWTVTKVTSDLAADRALFYVIVILMLTIIIFHKHLSFGIPTMTKRLLSLMIIATLLSYHLITQYSITRAYADACDSRIQMLVDAKQPPKAIQPLPSSGFLFSSEISSDSTHHANKHLREGLNLEFTPVATQKTR